VAAKLLSGLGTDVAPARIGLAQDVPGIACIVANADTGVVSDMRDLPSGGMLIGAEKGLFLARAVNGAVTVAQSVLPTLEPCPI
jgi:hypothetical protein